MSYMYCRKTSGGNNVKKNLEKNQRLVLEIIYGDSQDGLQIYSGADNFVVLTGYLFRTRVH